MMPQRIFAAVVAILWTVFGSRASAQGLINPGARPINRAMASASTAAPVDFGSTYWNPANLSGLERHEFLLGSELVIPSTHFTSSLPQGSTFSTAWVHGFRNSIQGGLKEELGAFTKLDVQTDSIIAGMDIRFGGKSRSQRVAEMAQVEAG